VAPTHRFLAVLSLATLAACGARQVAVAPAPSSPEATVGQFLAAVNANDHGRIAALFGDERGPSTVTWPNQARLDSIVTIMQHLLVTDSAHVVGSEPVPGHGTRRVLRMDLFHSGNRATVPFTFSPQHAGGWLVKEVDLTPLMPSVNRRSNP
jgi:hypothetical protein